MRKLILGICLIGVLTSCLCVPVSCSNDNLADAFAMLKNEGLSDVAAAAIVGNIAQESGGDPACVELGKNGKGIGIFQLSNKWNRQTLVEYCAGPEHINHQKVTLSPGNGEQSFTVCNSVRCQIEATLPGIKSTLNSRSWTSYYNSQVDVLEVLNQGVVSGQLPQSISVTNSWKGFCAQTDLRTAVLQFMCDYETPGVTKCFWVGIDSYSDAEDIQNGFISSFNYRYSAALRAYNAYSGKSLPLPEPVIEVVVTPEPVEEVVVIEEPVMEAPKIIEEKVLQPMAELPEDVIVTEVGKTDLGVAMLSKFGVIDVLTPSLDVNTMEDNCQDNWVVQFLFSVVGDIMIVFAILLHRKYCFYSLSQTKECAISVRVDKCKQITSLCCLIALVGFVIAVYPRG